MLEGLEVVGEWPEWHRDALWVVPAKGATTTRCGERITRPSARTREDRPSGAAHIRSVR